MRFLTWSLRLALFLLLLGFAVKNDQAVVLRYFFGLEWQTSLVVALLCFFAIGVVIGLLAMLGSLLRQRRELASVRRELQPKPDSAEQDAMTRPPTTPPEILS
ncbi:MAG: LapA family protein [Pseudomonadota bacterium]